jgi:zinc/manganese transport system ATP-binding protein
VDGYADEPAGLLSGGELQRVRVAQALAAAPALLLCDEPLAALDLRHQADVVRLIAERQREAGGAVVFVTHDITPVLPYVDRVLYLAGGSYRLGTVDDVLTAESLTALYGAPVEVIRAAGRLLVVPSASVGDTSLGECR